MRDSLVKSQITRGATARGHCCRAAAPNASEIVGDMNRHSLAGPRGCVVDWAGVSSPTHSTQLPQRYSARTHRALKKPATRRESSGIPGPSDRRGFGRSPRRIKLQSCPGGLAGGPSALKDDEIVTVDFPHRDARVNIPLKLENLALSD